MLDLHGTLRSMSVHRVGQLGKAGNLGILVHREAGDRGPARQAVRRGGPDDDEAAAALGDLFVVRDHPLIHRAIGIRRGDVRGHMADPVRHFEIPDADRGEHLWILDFAHVSLLVLSRFFQVSPLPAPDASWFFSPSMRFCEWVVRSLATPSVSPASIARSTSSCSRASWSGSMAFKWSMMNLVRTSKARESHMVRRIGFPEVSIMVR